jgi:replicative DNA helicase
MAFNIGLKALKKLAADQKPLAWHNAKLTKSLFKGIEEESAFEWVEAYVTKHHQVPPLETLQSQFPVFKEFETPDPLSYYTDLLEERYAYGVINEANIKSQDLLKENKHAVKEAATVLEQSIQKIKAQQYRTKILDMSTEGPLLVLSEYHSLNKQDAKVIFGWPYMDESTGGALPGDVISIVGRPAMGKTFLVLKSSIVNWRAGLRVMVVSMEMNPLAIAQRTIAMYGHLPLTQLKTGSYSNYGATGGTYKKFKDSLVQVSQQEGKLYVVDGNLAAHCDDIYILAAQLGVDAIYIDGAYLMKHKNTRLNRFDRVAENAEMMKHQTSEIGLPTFASWQLSREAAKKAKKAEDVGLEDIGMSDAIGQVSSIVLGLFQEETAETLHRRLIDVMKGRNGEVGEFLINWDFIKMDFDQCNLDAEHAAGAITFV